MAQLAFQYNPSGRDDVERPKRGWGNQKHLQYQEEQVLMVVDDDGGGGGEDDEDDDLNKLHVLYG